MANSYVLYTSVAGGTTNLNVPFSYLDVDQVDLYIDDVLQTKVTHWDFTTPTNIALVTPTSGGDDILIKRATNIASAEVTFSNAMLVDTDLNTSHLQNFYLHQELLDNLALGDITLDGTSLDATGITDGYVLTADGAGNVAWEIAPTGPTGPTGPAGADGGGLADVVDDLTPQLGGTLDANTFRIDAADGDVVNPGYSFGTKAGYGFRFDTSTMYLVANGIDRFKWNTSYMDGTGASTGSVSMKYSNGVVSTPAYSFTNDQNSGMYRVDVDEVGISAGGLLVASFKEVASAGQLIVDPGVTGSAALPSLAFGDGNTGFYESADNDLTMTAAGINQFVFSPGEFRSTVSTAALLKRSAGTVGAPSFSFWNDEDCGMWRTAADSIAFSAGGIEAMRMSESGSLISTTMEGDVAGNFITPVNGQAANYTMLLSDAGKTIRFTGATAAQTYTIPANASVAYPIGTMIGIENDGSVAISLAITTDTLTWSKDNTTGTRTLAAGASAVIKKTTATTWKISGSALVT